MVQTGKRHDWNRYRVGFNDQGLIFGVEMHLAGMCGRTADLSEESLVVFTQTTHIFPAATIKGFRCRTNTVSNTAFRGFGGPKGMMAAESMVDDISRFKERSSRC